jgi:hypothetical protein
MNERNVAEITSYYDGLLSNSYASIERDGNEADFVMKVDDYQALCDALADAIPREIHERLITAVSEIYELLAINTADSINAAYLRAKEETEIAEDPK